MIFTSSKKRSSLAAGALIIAHFAVCFLAPWFHQHPEQDHAGVKGEFYHSHASAFTSHPPQSEQNHYDLPAALHHLEGSQLFDELKGTSEAHFGQIIFFGKYAPKIDLFGLPTPSISRPAFAAKTFLKLPPVPPTQSYFVLIAAGLSPPAPA